MQHVRPAPHGHPLRQHLPGHPVLQHFQLDCPPLPGRQPAHQPRQFISLPPQPQHGGIRRQAEHRQHPQPLTQQRLHRTHGSNVESQTHITPDGQRLTIDVRQFQRRKQQKVRLLRHLHPHCHRCRRHDRPAQLDTQHLRTDPPTQPLNHFPLMVEPPVRIGLPPHIPIQIAERRHLSRVRPQLDLMVSHNGFTSVIEQ
jgi:hypothetical protein